MRRNHILEIKHEAVFEIEDAYQYYEEQQAGLGDIFQKSLEKTFKTIIKTPYGFTKLSNDRRQTVVKKFPFVIVYEVFDTTIVVFAVFHTSRNPYHKIR
jgi:plasmid stabilization system protein ParE